MQTFVKLILGSLFLFATLTETKDKPTIRDIIDSTDSLHTFKPLCSIIANFDFAVGIMNKSYSLGNYFEFLKCSVNQMKDRNNWFLQYAQFDKDSHYKAINQHMKKLLKEVFGDSHKEKISKMLKSYVAYDETNFLTDLGSLCNDVLECKIKIKEASQKCQSLYEEKKNGFSSNHFKGDNSIDENEQEESESSNERDQGEQIDSVKNERIGEIVFYLIESFIERAPVVSGTFFSVPNNDEIAYKEYYDLSKCLVHLSISDKFKQYIDNE
ncbi:MAG: hypothetical protein MHPSP_002389 [Paramarteilia canceri]